MTIEEAYARCAALARASSTSFYRGMRMLPRDRRAAMFAVYALARQIDDVADGVLPAEEKARALAAVRESLASPAPPPDEPALIALAHARTRFPIPMDAFCDLVRGAEMDLAPRAYETFDDLVVYCRCVAGSIGRLCVGVFETDDRARADALADDLGVAFQLTNVLRDVREDLESGRVYLPQEDLRSFGCSAGPVGFSGPFDALVRFEAARAEEWYERGLRLLTLVDRKSAASVATMAGVYRRLLRRIVREPRAVLERRVALGRLEKGLVVARSLAGHT